MTKDKAIRYCSLPDCAWRVGHPKWGFTTLDDYHQHLSTQHYLGPEAVGAEPIMSGIRYGN